MKKLINYFTYSKWVDLGIEYIPTDYKYVVIQTRTRNRDNLRQFRSVKISQYNNLTDSTKNRIQKEIENGTN